ncbi:ferredoxin-NADP reductase/predicted pyridoxine 5'-phosphate oxidase superfamily flavin-nucleotide-binding protein [Inquilinus ginsengisoli]|uniref:pyridoxamine 5'-phosphate oxidase family protein n=1 Tax=Inquilinus ginsengisoli TaxID=363840 RepID=UPI003D1E9843
MPNTIAAPAPLPGWPHEAPPFHPGEVAAQTRAGVRERMAAGGRRAIRGIMPDQHRDFFAMLPFIVVGSLDRQGRPWASILSGRPGFLQSPDPRTLTVAARPAYGDPLGDNLAAGAPVGLLGIQLETRRRNRMNGTVSEWADGRFAVTVGQSFGNCPQYIQARRPSFVAEPDSLGEVQPVHAEGQVLSSRAAALVAAADTFFIATRSADAVEGEAPSEGVDVSHRGGRPGFVRGTEEGGRTVLTAPDFVGNFFFNTFGNIEVDPRAGLVFVDFDTGGVLLLTGTAEVVWDGPEVAAFAGAERLLRFRVEEGRWIEDAVPLRWSAPQQAVQLAATGTWDEAGRVAKAEASRNTLRPFTVAGIVQESATIRSFILEPADGGSVVPHQPGQFLPIALDIPGRDQPVRRTYTLSDAADGRTYRISVKRETGLGDQAGLASHWLHDQVRVGDTIRALAPRGDFVLDTDSRRPVLLLSAGVGVTPMIAMLNGLIGRNPDRLRHPGRGIWFVHAARDGSEHAFADHLRALAARAPTLTTHIRYSRPRPQDVPGRDYDDAGHIDAALLRRLLPLDDYDVYLCGPAGFMQAMREILSSLGVRPERIRSEAFAAGSAAPMDAAALPAAVATAEIEFRASGRRAAWDPSKGTLLDLAEAAGIGAPWSCRTGLCGTCTARVLDGAVTYAEPPAGAPRPGEALVCCAVPASGRVVLEL